VIRNKWAYWLLVIPYVALLAVPLYARWDPAIAGVPFFLWWQFAWSILTALLTYGVYRLHQQRHPRRG
jgi:hypothetical protein